MEPLQGNFIELGRVKGLYNNNNNNNNSDHAPFFRKQFDLDHLLVNILYLDFLTLVQLKTWFKI